MGYKELLNKVKFEIQDLRRTNEKLSIRVTAIDDMLCLLHGKSGMQPSQGESIDVVWEIDKALKESKENE